MAVIAIIAGVSLTANRNPIPDHMMHKPLVDLQSFFTEQEVDEMLQANRDKKVIPPMAREYDSYTPLNDNIGEATPYNKSVGCPQYLIPNPKKTLCIFPGRIDVGRHFILSGGPGGIKQRFATMVAPPPLRFHHLRLQREGKPVGQEVVQPGQVPEFGQVSLPCQPQQDSRPRAT